MPEAETRFRKMVPALLRAGAICLAESPVKRAVGKYSKKEDIICW